MKTSNPNSTGVDQTNMPTPSDYNNIVVEKVKTLSDTMFSLIGENLTNGKYMGEISPHAAGLRGKNVMVTNNLLKDAWEMTIQRMQSAGYQGTCNTSRRNNCFTWRVLLQSELEAKRRCRQMAIQFGTAVLFAMFAVSTYTMYLQQRQDH